jgi:hypothetical protein
MTIARIDPTVLADSVTAQTGLPSGARLNMTAQTSQLDEEASNHLRPGGVCRAVGVARAMAQLEAPNAETMP